MKSFVYALVAASALAAPLASYAQTAENGPVTRAQVRQDLINVEQAGYNPSARSPYYPDDIQAAEQRVNAQQGYGGVTAGTSQSGAPAAVRPMGTDSSQPQSIYFGR
jgi:opacity protein-like surface antigen